MRTKCMLFLFWMIVSPGFIQAQHIARDVYVINPAGEDQNIAQVSQRHKARPDALYLSAGDQNPLETVTEFLMNKPCITLHLYVKYEDGALVFGSFRLTSANANSHRATLSKWSDKVSGKIVIHSLTMAEKGAIPDVVVQLESLTGIPVQIIRSY